MREKIKVLIVDDSAHFRQVLNKALSSDNEIEVIATAADPYIAASKMTQQVPDVITLDIDMPKMDGLTFLRKIMAQHPIPVIIISATAGRNTEAASKALEYGAVQVLSKDMFDSEITNESRSQICDIVKAASGAKIKKKSLVEAPVVHPKLSADVVLPFALPRHLVPTSEKIIAVGASTGGTQAIKMFLEDLPITVPGIVIVQHMPETFTRSFADRLNEICKIEVKEAEDGDLVKPGLALIAKGNHHLILRKKGTRYYTEINDGPMVNRHRPAVDVLFRSAALYAAKNAIGILLTGMGDDGAKGLLEIRQAGGKTIAQDESSSVVFGMPKEAILLNAAERVLPLYEIANHVIHLTAGLKYS